MTDIDITQLNQLWSAYLQSYLDEDTYQQVHELQPTYLKDLYNLNARSLFDTTFLHVEHIINAPHDLPHIYRETYTFKRHTMTLAMLGPKPRMEDGSIAKKLLESRTLADRSRETAKELSLLYDFYGYLHLYENGTFAAAQKQQFESILHDSALPYLFTAVGKTRRQQENHTWIWRNAKEIFKPATKPLRK